MSSNIINKLQKKGIGFCIKRALGITIHTPVNAVWKKILTKTSKIKKNQILFCSIPSFSDNAKALYIYLQKTYPGKYQYIWLIFKEDEIPSVKYPDTVFIRANSFYHRGYCLSALKAVANSEYICFTHSSPIAEIHKQKEQKVINLWHGCGYKAKEKTIKSGIEINPFDYVLVPGNIFIQTKADFWGCFEKQIIPFGYPRYDLMLRSNKDAALYCQQLKGNADKLIFWMPTFRNTGREKYPEEKISYTFELSLMHNEADLQKLNDFCYNNRIMICIKRHPMQKRYQSEKLHLSNIHFIDNHDIASANIEFYAMLHYTDALISDYSSISVDFLLMNRPIAFSLDDFDKYQSARGFVFEDPLKYMPGHHLYSFDDLIDFIHDISDGKDPYKKQREELLPIMHNPCDNYCERIWEFVKELDKNN